VAAESGKSFWRIFNIDETKLSLAHGGYLQVVPLAELHPASMPGFLAQDEAKKESLVTLQQATPARANRYYGWTKEQLKARWGLPITTFTVTWKARVETERRRPTRTVYTGGRRVDRCERDDWPVDFQLPHQSYQLLVYQADDPDHATGFVFYGKHQTVGGGFFKGIPILNPKKKVLAETTRGR